MRVLLIRLSSLGDVVLATAAVEALHREVPQARVHVLTKPAFRPLFHNTPGVDEVLGWDPSAGLGDLAREVRRGSYDWVVDLHANLRTRLLRGLVPGGQWSVYRKGSLRRRLAVLLHRPGLLPRRHAVDRYLEALRPLGGSGRRYQPRLAVTDSERSAAWDTLRALGWDGDSPPIALAPGARWATKAWPLGHWAELLRRLVDAGGGTPLLLGGAGESALCDDILAAAGVPALNLAGLTTIRQTGAVLEHCGVLVTNDSAPLHLATAVGTRVVALFGPTVQGFGFYPLGEDDAVLETAEVCRPCSLHGDDRCPREHHRCLECLSADTVIKALGRFPGGSR